MQAYCLKNQIEGYQAVARSASSPVAILTSNESETIQQHCRVERPGDFEMQAYCQRQQADGIAFLKGQPDMRGLQACVREWPGDYEMQTYCVRQGWY